MAYTSNEKKQVRDCQKTTFAMELKMDKIEIHVTCSARNKKILLN